MAIKTITKRIKKGQAIIDLKSQIQNSFNVVNSAILNIEATLNEMKNDPDFNFDEMQEFKNILLDTLGKSNKIKNKCTEIYNEISLG
jgi:formiminotetrahydrofolate cyclodeaminase